MRTHILLIVAAFLFVIAGCDNSGSREKKVPVSGNFILPQNTNVPLPGSQTNPPPGNLTINPGTNPQTITTIPVAEIPKNINPAHGQPGHRCDIAVGAPLDSKPQIQSIPANSSPVSVTPAATTPVTTTSNPTVIAPGMNPEHGKPGHRCDIAVGAPLNSKPITTTQSVSEKSETIISTPATTPTSVSMAPTTTQKDVTPLVIAPGMNPEHGKPGHRCDIAVGAPLNSIPVNTPIINPVKKDQ